MPRRGYIWNFFNNVDESNRRAECNYCLKYFSFKTTMYNLKSHLRSKHTSIYEELCRNSQSGNNVDKASREVSKHASEIRGYFEQEVGGSNRCVICRATRTSNLNDLKEHLKEKHPKLLAEIEQESEPESDNEDSSENTYTEIVYLEDEMKNEKKNEKKKSEPTPNKSNAPKKQKCENDTRKESSFEEMPVKRQTPENEELESFVKYISCLLKQVPKVTFGKLQMDIVNLIMNAKLNCNVTLNNVVFENIQSASSIDNMRMLITHRKEPDNVNNSLSVAEYKVISQNNIPVTSAGTGTCVTTLDIENNCGNIDC